MSLRDLENLSKLSWFEEKKRVVEEFCAKNPDLTELDLSRLYFILSIRFSVYSLNLVSHGEF